MEFFSHLFADPTFWVAMSIVLCVGYIARKAAGPLLGALDARSDMIRTRLHEASVLHEEAKALLEEYKNKSQNAQREAEEVLRSAQARAEAMRAEMENELKTTIARMEASAKQRIARMEIEALEGIKATLINDSIARVREQMQNDTANANDRPDSLARIGKMM